MQLACSTLTFGKNKNEESFNSTLESIKSAGYRGVQLERDLLPDSLLRKPERVREIVRDIGLETVAVAVTSDPYDVRFTGEVDGKVGTLCLFERNFVVAENKTRRLLELASKVRVNLAIHPHIRSNVDTIQSVEKLLDRFGKSHYFSLVFDSAHFIALGWNIKNFLERFHSKISVAHIKDLKGLKNTSKINYHRDFVDLGDGIVDFTDLIRDLKQVGFSGWLIMEVDHPQLRTPKESVRRNYEILSKLVSD